MKKSRLTKEIVKQRINHRNIKMIGEYIDIGTKAIFECSKGHNWLAKPNNIMSRESGCPECDGQKPLSINIVNQRIIDKNVIMIGDYRNVDTLSLFHCNNCNIDFKSKPYVMMTKSFCPNCHERSGGFKKYKPGTFYIILFPEYNCIKYGITNNLHERILKHNRSNKCDVLFTKEFNIGNDALLMENLVKTTFGGKFIDKSILEDGWTETLPVEYFHKIKELFT